MSAKDRTDAKARHDENSRSKEKGHRLNIFIAVIAVLTLITTITSLYLQLMG